MLIVAIHCVSLSVCLTFSVRQFNSILTLLELFIRLFKIFVRLCIQFFSNFFFQYISNDGSVCIFRTNKGAPNYRLIKIDLHNPAEENWVTLIPVSNCDAFNTYTQTHMHARPKARHTLSHPIHIDTHMKRHTRLIHTHTKVHHAHSYTLADRYTTHTQVH